MIVEEKFIDKNIQWPQLIPNEMIKIIDDGMHKCNLFERLHLVKGGCVAKLARRYLDPFVYKSLSKKQMPARNHFDLVLVYSNIF